jgi:hypothetical protein
LHRGKARADLRKGARLVTDRMFSKPLSAGAGLVLPLALLV